jgi:hypothetical protein
MLGSRWRSSKGSAMRVSAYYTHMIPIIMAMMLVSSPAIAISDNDKIEQLINRYGKNTIILEIIYRRNPFITIYVDNKFLEFRGEPDEKFISPATILQDLKKLSISIDHFEPYLLAREERKNMENADRLQMLQELVDKERKKQEDERKKREEIENAKSADRDSTTYDGDLTSASGYEWVRSSLSLKFEACRQLTYRLQDSPSRSDLEVRAWAYSMVSCIDDGYKSGRLEIPVALAAAACYILMLRQR